VTSDAGVRDALMLSCVEEWWGEERRAPMADRPE